MKLHKCIECKWNAEYDHETKMGVQCCYNAADIYVLKIDIDKDGEYEVTNCPLEAPQQKKK